MKRQAPALYSWVERMNAVDPDLPDFPAQPPAFLERWVDKHAPRDGDPVSPRAHSRTLGMVDSEYRGEPVTVVDRRPQRDPTEVLIPD
ncbi:hypothetical protein [Sphingomonas sp. PAMC 26605]|uniref:hypothetical protein n=1 Tax=Sphingomonas sp. PAMC 26605 TaxID=1112214 RepID=UPI00026CD7FC|nr:hypothetical protein [Sphingomonas sp. PAMC 26605]